MYVLSQNLSGSADISSYFSDDFFNSSIIYQFSRINSDHYVMTYKTREDLISRDFYLNPNYLGLVFMSVGPTIYKKDSKIIIPEEFEPLNEISLKDLQELRSSQLLSVASNPMTSKEINPLRNPGKKVYEYKSSTRRFKPTNQN